MAICIVRHEQLPSAKHRCRSDSAKFCDQGSRDGKNPVWGTASTMPLGATSRTTSRAFRPGDQEDESLAGERASMRLSDQWSWRPGDALLGEGLGLMLGVPLVDSNVTGCEPRVFDQA